MPVWEEFLELLGPFEWSFQLLGWIGFASALATSFHVILKKRDSRSAISWMGLIWLSPFLGALTYFIFGVNRIRRTAQSLRSRLESLPARETLGENIPIESAGQLRLGDRVTRMSAVGGNSVQMLVHGTQAYPAMIHAIENAKFTVTLCTYIFDYDAAGLRFADALENAVKRGVQVRVLIDDIGARYSKRRMDRELRRRGVRVARFLPLFRPRSLFFINLRLHRKILVVDGVTAFTGGMNIRAGHEADRHLPGAVQDTHFMLRGPVVRDIQHVFANDWEFTTGERLKSDVWFPVQMEQGTVLARCVEDGPDGHFENARWILLGAIHSAQRHIRIMTPYFLPDAVLITALNAAAMRGVRVQVVLPQLNNLPWVHWAGMGGISQLIERGCEVFLSPGPFDHTKLMTVDGRWLFLGSINWDDRSLRLNFELNVEAYDTQTAAIANAHIEAKLAASRLVLIEHLLNRSFPVRLRDGFARLFSPYL